MGMFDTIICEATLPYVAYELPHPHDEWQTKDLHCTMSTYIMRDNSPLIHRIRRYEEHPTETEEWLSGRVVPKMVLVDTIYKEVDDYHGDIRFYDRFNVENECFVWIEFEARYTEGVLSRIKLLSTEEKDFPEHDTLLATLKNIPIAKRREDVPDV